MKTHSNGIGSESLTQGSEPCPAQFSEETPAPERGRTRRLTGGLLIATLAVLTLLLISLATGEYSILTGSEGSRMFFDVRIPRTIALILSGAAMSMSGLVMQLITQNRFAEPTTTGTTEWAGLGLLLIMAIFPGASVLTRMTGAVCAAFVGTMVFFLLLNRVSLRSSLLVPILGIMLGSVVSAVSTFIALQANMLQSLGIWFQGSFTSVYTGQYEVLWIVAGVVAIVFLLADRLTAVGLGEDVATSIGVNYRRMILIATGLVAMATGVVTVVVGSLPFLGLIVPNIVSMVRGDDLRSNLPWVVVMGIGLVTVCDLLARIIISPFEIPVSVILGILGASVFIVLVIMRSRKNSL
nr:iron chelate uptake ABC transporter family permease subunit [Schaalia sp. lx-100]